MTKFLKDYSLHISLASLISLLTVVIASVAYSTNIVNEVNANTEFRIQQTEINQSIVQIERSLEILLPGYK